MGDFSKLAIRIKELRSSSKMTQKEFAEMIGCTAATLSAYENNLKRPSFEIIKSIAEKCNVSIDWLCGISEQKSNDSNFQTYGDIANILFKLEKVAGLRLSFPNNPEISELSNELGWRCVIFHDSVINNFLNEWNDMQEMLNSSLKSETKDKFYDLWVKDKMNELSKIQLPDKSK